MHLTVQSFLALDDHAFGCLATSRGLQVPEDLARCFQGAVFEDVEDFIVTVRTQQPAICMGLHWPAQRVLDHTTQLFEMLVSHVDPKLLRPFLRPSRKLAAVR